MAVEHLHLAPSEYWSLTLSEFDILTSAHIDRLDREAGRFTRKELAELEAVGQAAMEAETRVSAKAA